MLGSTSMRFTSARFPKTYEWAKKDRYVLETMNAVNYKDDSGHGNQLMLQTAVAKSKLDYGSAFRSKTPRFKATVADRELREALNSLDFVDPDCGSKASVAKMLSVAAKRPGAEFRSRRPRFQRPKKRFPIDDRSAVPQLQTDVGPNMTLATAVQRSPRKLAVAGAAATPRFRPLEPGAERYRRNLGPGAYGVPSVRAVRPRTATVTMTRSPRFGDTHDPCKWLGSTYTQAADTRAWTSRGFASPRTERPAISDRRLVDQVYNVDALNKQSIATGVRKSPRAFKTSFQSAVPRQTSPIALRFKVTANTRMPDPSPDHGPGTFDPNRLTLPKGLQQAGVTVREPRRPSAPYASTSPRFPNRVEHMDPVLQQTTYRTLDTTHNKGTVEDTMLRSAQRYSAMRQYGPLSAR